MLFNQQQVELTGENHALLHQDKLEGAIGRIESAYAYGLHDCVSLAVLLMMGIVTAHAFEQGNKRTAFVSAFAFLQINGWDLTADADEVIMAVALVEAMVDKDKIADLEDLVRHYTYEL